MSDKSDSNKFDIDEFQKFCNSVSATMDMENEEVTKHLYDHEKDDVTKYGDVCMRMNESFAHIDIVLFNMKLIGRLTDVVKRFVFYADSSQVDLLEKEYREGESRESNSLYIKRIEKIPRLIHSLMGLITETGEMAEAIISFLTTGELDTVNINEELADANWYICEGASGTSSSMSDILSKVQKKLESRMGGDGKSFSSEKVLNRDLDAERKELEKDA